MIYEYAISPELFADYRDVQLLQASFGKGYGRLFSKVPKKEWLKAVQKVIKESGNKPVMRERLKSAAKKLVRYAGYMRVEQPDTIEQHWLDSILQAHSKRPFHAILVPEYSGDVPEVLANDFTLQEQDLWKVDSTLRIARNADKMVETICPMLECAREIILIDRNFKPDKSRFINVLIKIFRTISEREHGSAISKITYHLGDEWGVDHLQMTCKDRLAHKIPCGMRLDIVTRPWDELHDRFVLTDIGGVEFGVGLDESLGGGVPEVRIKLMPEEDYREEWKRAHKTDITFSIASTLGE